MDPTPGEPRSHQDRPAEAGPAVEDHGRVVTANRRAAAFYRQAQRATDAHQAMTALRLTIDADPAFALAIADLNAIAGTAGRLANHQQLSWERHHIEVVRSAASGDGARAAGLLREHLASVGCDPLAVHIVAQLRQPGGHDDDLEDLTCRLPGCHLARWPPIPDADREG
ncbi:MAG TPA: hypothetical protein VHW04_13920 [Solirubrobacteraceae bacterium]|jgi:hypothetical protein|nr:hypothetical protein [Solirubrobacteraceae bacterium]